MSFQSRFKVLLLQLSSLVLVPDVAISDVPVFFEDFNGTSLDAGWTTWDGYALAHPADTANHATFGVANSKLTIGIPGGVEHNQWWLKHSAVTRSYEGSGVYKIKMDTIFEESQQFGIVFESGPGNFVMFMLHGDYYVWGYIERFRFYNGTQYRKTYPLGGYTDLTKVPQSGPLYLRVTLEDDADPTLRNWKMEWSKDDSVWLTIFDGPAETGDPSGNIGAIQRVGIFAGNQVELFTAFDAAFDYFETHPDPAVATCGNSVVETGEQCDDGGTADGDCCDSACQFETPGSSCSDGSACTVADTCDGSGSCDPGPPLTVDDGNPCTDDSCDPLLGAVHTANTAPCDDADACTTADTCSAGACVGGAALTVDDGNPCTDDSCDPLLGAVHTANTAPCDDADACTTADTCSAGACVGGAPVDPDDGVACTVDSCDPALGIINEWAAGPSCNAVPAVSAGGGAILTLLLGAAGATLLYGTNMRAGMN